MTGGGPPLIIPPLIPPIIGGRPEIEITIHWNILLLGKEGGEPIQDLRENFLELKVMK